MNIIKVPKGYSKKEFLETLHKTIAKNEKGSLTYGRMFTEPRKDGVRCKLWICNADQKEVNKVTKRLNSAFPNFTVIGTSEQTSGFNGGYFTPNSVCFRIYFNESVK